MTDIVEKMANARHSLFQRVFDLPWPKRWFTPMPSQRELDTVSVRAVLDDMREWGEKNDYLNSHNIWFLDAYEKERLG